jgi:hypothetical protein
MIWLSCLFVKTLWLVFLLVDLAVYVGFSRNFRPEELAFGSAMLHAFAGAHLSWWTKSFWRHPRTPRRTVSDSSTANPSDPLPHSSPDSSAAGSL